MGEFDRPRKKKRRRRRRVNLAPLCLLLALILAGLVFLAVQMKSGTLLDAWLPMGDVTIGGLGNTDTTYGRVFLYSGHVEDSITDTKQTLDIPDYIQKAEHTLTIDSGSEHTFGGYVLGSLNLVKKGKGNRLLPACNGCGGTGALYPGKAERGIMACGPYRNDDTGRITFIGAKLLSSLGLANSPTLLIIGFIIITTVT